MSHVLGKQVVTNVKIVQQTYAAIVLSLTILMAAYWTIYTSPVLLIRAKGEGHLQLTQSEISWIMAILNVGTILSPIPATTFISALGQKKTLIVASVIYLLSSLFTIFATGSEHLFTARLLSGIAKGFSFTVFPLYVAEISSKTIRGALNSLLYASFCIGTILASGVGPHVSFPHLNYIGLILPILFLVLSLPLPESPHHYLVKNKYEMAEKSMAWYRDIRTKRQKFLTDYELSEAQIALRAPREHAASQELFTKGAHKLALRIVVTVTVAQQFGGVGYFLEHATQDLPRSRSVFSREKCFVGYAVVSLCASVASGLLSDRVGRKPLLVISAASTSVCTMVGALYFVVRPRMPVDRLYYWIPYSVLIAFSVVFTAGLGIVPAILQGELFAPPVKRLASAIVVVASTLASCVATLIHGPLVQQCGVAGNYFLAAISTGAFAFWSYSHVFETKGRSLVEIQEYLATATGTAAPAASTSSPPSAVPQRVCRTWRDTPGDTHHSLPGSVSEWNEYHNSNGGAYAAAMDMRRTVSGSNLYENENQREQRLARDKFYLSEFKSMSLHDLNEVEARF